MPLYLLDTDHLSLHQRGHYAVMRRVQATPNQDIVASIISFEEQLRGWLNVLRQVENSPKLPLAYQSLREMQTYYCRLRLLDFDAQAQHIYDRLRATYRRQGTMDLRIAACAINSSAILVTRNQRDFSQIPKLQLEDWTLT